MQLVEENRQRDQDRQNEFIQNLVGQDGAVRNRQVGGVGLSEFQDTRPTPFATAAEPMDTEDWLLDVERKLMTVGCNDEEKV
jgi:hypothetical protein